MSQSTDDGDAGAQQSQNQSRSQSPSQTRSQRQSRGLLPNPILDTLAPATDISDFITSLFLPMPISDMADSHNDTGHVHSFRSGIAVIPPDDFQIPGGWGISTSAQQTEAAASFPSPGVLDSLLKSVRDHDADIYPACLLRHTDERKSARTETDGLGRADESIPWAETAIIRLGTQPPTAFTDSTNSRAGTLMMAASWHPHRDDNTISTPPSVPGFANPLRATTQAAVLEGQRLRVSKGGATASGPNTGLGAVYANFASCLVGDPTRFSLSETLSTIGDLQTYNFMVGGRLPSYAALLVGEAVVRGSMGPHPLLDLCAAYRSSDMSLICFSQADLGHCLCSKRRTPVFTLAGNNITIGNAMQAFPDTVDGIAYTMPLPLQEILHEVVSAVPHSPDALLSGFETRIRALFTHNSVPPIWSRAALVVLYQRLRAAGALHPVVRATSWDILLHLDPQPCLKVQVFPLFIAGTVAFLQTQRDAVNLRWVHAPEKGFEEGLKFLESLWAEMDRTGRTVDWLDFAEQKKVALVFF